ncbi:MAG: hypothetical protein VXW32_02955 [Myxococcota bacterium]|nr:hypothetical protein [Myxococcota bacterium]
MTIWKVHRLMIVAATLFSGTFGVQTLRIADGDTSKLVVGSISLFGTAALLLYFRWFQQKTGKRNRPKPGES